MPDEKQAPVSSTGLPRRENNAAAFWRYAGPIVLTILFGLGALMITVVYQESRRAGDRIAICEQRIEERGGIVLAHARILERHDAVLVKHTNDVQLSRDRLLLVETDLKYMREDVSAIRKLLETRYKNPVEGG